MKRKIGLLLVGLMVLMAFGALGEGAALPDLTATERGGTWVIRVPEAALSSMAIEHGQPPEGTEDMTALLGQSLSDAITARFAVPADGSLLMCVRVIDGDGCLVVRPDTKYDARHPFRWQAVEMTGDIFGAGGMSVNGVSAVNTYAPKVSRGDYEQVFSREYDRLDIDVYHAGGMSIAVVHQDGKTKRDKLTGTLRIGDQPAIPVTGYVSGKQTIYCCVLTDAELGALVAGAKPVVTSVERAVSESTQTPVPAPTVYLPDLSLDLEEAGE